MSIRNYLLMIILSSIVLVCFGAAIEGYKSSMKQADALFDQELESIATVMVQLGSKSLAAEQNAIDPSIFINYAIQVWQQEQLKLNLSPYQATTPIAKFIAGFDYANFAGQRWRTYSYPSEFGWILVAQPQKYRFELAESMTLAAVTPLIVSMPFLALLISFTVKQSLKPLKQLTETLNAKQADDLCAIEVPRQSIELIPVVNTLNHLLERVEGAYLREKHFASDAAHELRTPLSILKVSLHNLMAQTGPSSDNLAALDAGIERMSHIVEQILLLNRTHPDQFKRSFTVLALTPLVQEVVSDLYPQILEKDHEISFSGEDLKMRADAFTFKTLLQNLIGNAIKYTPDQGKISVTLQYDAHDIVLTVSDSGPGIAPSERDRIFDRFYRVGGDQHQSQVIGCGLGLSIVKHIADLYQAKIALAQSEWGGLAISLRFTQDIQFKEKTFV